MKTKRPQVPLVPPTELFVLAIRDTYGDTLFLYCPTKESVESTIKREFYIREGRIAEVKVFQMHTASVEYDVDLGVAPTVLGPKSPLT